MIYVPFPNPIFFVSFMKKVKINNVAQFTSENEELNYILFFLIEQ